MRWFALAAVLAAAPVAAAPVPVFDQPRDLLVAVYDQIERGQEWETYDYESAFSEVETFSTALSSLLVSADEKVMADGDEMGALDFSPFINGQDSGGMDFEIGEAKVKGDRAVASVQILLEGAPWQVITVELVDEGDAGWKVDDVILPMVETDGTWRLTDYLADPLAP